MKTLVILPAPSDVDTAAGKYNAGLAGEMLSDYLTKHTTDITYKYVAELDKRIYMEYPYILLVGDRPRTWADCPNWCYTYKRGPARVIAVPEHTLALDLRRQAYTEEDEDDDQDDDAGDNKDIAPTRIVNYRYWIEVGINKLFRRECGIF